MNKSIILVEHDTDLNIIKRLSRSQNTIITLDFIAHKNLLAAQIDHEIIEDFFEPDDEKYIDDLIIDKSTNWYKNDQMISFLEFQDINLGWLLENEIFSYMTRIIRKFVGIIRLLENNSFEHAYCSSSVSEMIQNISNKIETHTVPTKSVDDLHHENIEIPLKIGGKHTSIRLSRNSALKIKKFMECSTNIFTSSKLNQKKTKKRLLLLDFNIVLYEDLISELSKQFEIVLLNERKPVVWNLQSLKISRKLKCKIIHLNDFNDFSTSQEIDKSLKVLNQNLNELFEHEEYFKIFFSALNKSFWSVIKKNFIKTCNDRFNDSLRRFILARKFFKNSSIDRIIILYNVAFEERMILSAMRPMQIPGILLEHGYLPNPSYLKKYSSIVPINPGFGFKNGLWGKRSYDLFLKLGISDENLLVIGSPRHDSFFKASKLPSKKIIFFDAFPIETTFQSFDTHLLIENEKTIEKICRKLNDLKSHDFSVKLHPGQHAMPYSLKPMLKKINKRMPIHQLENPLDLLSACSLVIASGHSTILIEAMILGIPTITYIPNNTWNEEDVFTSQASILVHSYEDFESNLFKLLHDEKFRKALILRGNKYVKNYFSFQGSSSKNLIKQMELLD